MVRLSYLNPVLPVLFVLVIVGLVSSRVRLRRIGLGAAILVILWNWSPFTAAFGAVLERWYPVQPVSQLKVPAGEAMVILSGDMITPEPHRPLAHLGPETELRLQYALWLYRHWGVRVPVVVTGGVAKVGADSLADMMAARLVESGVPEADIIVERQAKNTWEHAVYTKKLLEPRGIHKVIVVTEAYHMLRAEGVFRRNGFSVRPAPCCYRMLDIDWEWSNLMPDPRAGRKNDTLLHEVVGLLAYRLSGRL